MKKILFALTLILIISVSTAFATFSDMPTFESYKTAIEYLTQEGVINGYEDNTFRPANQITRAEFAKMIITALGENCEEALDSKFEDVDVDFWATKYINKSAELGLVNGYEDDTFKPQNKITYSEVAAVIIRAMGKEDLAKTSDKVVMQNYMSVAYDLKLFSGVVTNDLVYISPARRDNVALMIYNMLNFEEQPKEDEKEEVIDTKLLRVGFVRGTMLRNGVISFSLDDGEEDFTFTYAKDLEDFPAFMQKVGKDEITMPEELIGKLLIYKVDSKGNINLLKVLSVEEIEDISTAVIDVDEELIMLDGGKIFDTSDDEYEDIKLAKCYFYIIEYGENREGKVRFESAELRELENLGAEAEDRIYFSEDGKICIVFRKI